MQFFADTEFTPEEMETVYDALEKEGIEIVEDLDKELEEIEVSKEEYLVYTTEKTEKSKLLEKKKKKGSMISAIKSYVNLNS